MGSTWWPGMWSSVAHPYIVLGRTQCAWGRKVWVTRWMMHCAHRCGAIQEINSWWKTLKHISSSACSPCSAQWLSSQGCYDIVSNNKMSLALKSLFFVVWTLLALSVPVSSLGTYMVALPSHVRTVIDWDGVESNSSSPELYFPTPL